VNTLLTAGTVFAHVGSKEDTTMKRWRLGMWGLMLALGATTGCASVHSGAYGVPVDAANRATGQRETAAGLKISADELTRWSSPQFGMIEVTFENESTEWIELRDVAIALPPDTRPGTEILASHRIASFRDAALRNEAIREQNLAVALGILTLGGLIVAETTEGVPQALGATAAAAGLGGLVLASETAAADKAQHVQPFPESHLLAGPFSVGPGMHTKKWIVLQTNPSVTRACVDHIRLQYRVQQDREERVWLTFRDSGSAWQRELCW
jgi:hypothetical protein